MNLDTLRDRVNDAVNTIIRRDESTETGELLPPCVEGNKSFHFFLCFFRSSCQIMQGALVLDSC